MTTDQNAAQSGERRVRPWIAALLTLLGPSLGFFYARRTRLAIWVAVLSIVLSLGVAVGLGAHALATRSTRLLGGIGLGDTVTGMLVQWGLTIAFAIWAWVAAAQRKSVPRAGPARLFGYFLALVLPVAMALAIAAPLRFLAYQPFRTPSGSMQPTLAVGAYLVANKWVYGYGRYSFTPLENVFAGRRIHARTPLRGDIVVFRPAPEPTRDFVKRIIGMPGDRIQVVHGVVIINGEPVAREPVYSARFVDDYGDLIQATTYRETLSNGVSYLTLDRIEDGELDDTRAFDVPDRHYFMLGDDRDNSADSRTPMMGFVPLENIVGRIDASTPSDVAPH